MAIFPVPLSPARETGSRGKRRFAVSDKAEDWRWVGEDGVEKSVAEQELIAELSSESLPNYTLVWKKGWLEWLPAMQVAELAWALPSGKADDPAKPRERPDAATPPAPPLYRYPVLKRRAANLRSDRPAPRRVRPVSPPRPPAPRPGSAAGGRPLEPETLALPKPAADITIPLLAPDLEMLSEPSHPSVEEVELDSIKSSDPNASVSKLADLSDAAADEDEDEAEEVEPDSADDSSPLGGFAPAPSGVAARAYSEDDEAETHVIASKPPPPGPLYVGPHVPPAPEKLSSIAEQKLPTIAEEPEFPQIPPAPPPPSDLSALAAARSRGPEEPRKRPPLVYVLAAVTAVLAVVVVVLLVHQSGNAPGAGKASSSAEPEESAAPGIGGEKPAASASSEAPPAKRIGKTCTVVTPATKLADWAEPSVTPVFAPVPGSGRVAVGLGQSDVYAVGITIDPKTLDRDQVFREYKRRQKLASVVPMTEGNHLRFQVARSGGDLSNARPVDAPQQFSVGTISAGIARLAGSGDPEVLWPLSSTEEVTVPRVASVPGAGFAVTFRHGGKSGRVACGWLDSKGRKKSDLADIKVDQEFSGTPSIASNDDSIVITFAVRGAQDSAWKVALASAKRGETPRKATLFSPPSGGPGGDAISPSVAPLNDGRWLLQWTEGSTGNRVVRAVVLDKDLALATDPVNLSPDGANAGQGVSFSSGNLGTILYYIRNDRKSNELWGASIDCAE